MEREDSFWLPSLGVGAAFWHNLQDLLGGGRRRSWGFRILFLELVFFPFEAGPWAYGEAPKG